MRVFVASYYDHLSDRCHYRQFFDRCDQPKPLTVHVPRWWELRRIAEKSTGETIWKLHSEEKAA